MTSPDWFLLALACLGLVGVLLMLLAGLDAPRPDDDREAIARTLDASGRPKLRVIPGGRR